MKSWARLAFIAAGLSYVLYFQFFKHEKPVELTSRALVDHPIDHRSATPGTKQSAPQRTMQFGGYPCPRDCSQDKAGYRWAERNGITDPDSCTGNTGAFIEGCRVYAEQRAAPLADK